MPNPDFRPQKTAMIIAHRIAKDINAKGNEPGYRLPPERVMLEEYSIGRGTLREALRFLELQGVISLKPGPGGGPIVRKPDASSVRTSLLLLLQLEKARFRTIAEARTGLEPMMARLAATRMTTAELSKLDSSVDVMRDNIASQEIFLVQSRLFHEVVAHGSGNAVFACMIDAILDMFDGSSIGVDYPEQRRKVVLDAHARIRDAIVNRDPDGAAEAMEEHIDMYIRYAERKFPEVMDVPIVWDGS